MRVRARRVLAAAALLVMLTVPKPALAVPVNLELLLLVDVSGSIDAGEYALQKTGYVTAFNNPTIQALIAARPGGIAVAYAEWADASQQSLLVNWTHLTDAASSSAFAAAINGTSRAFSGNTAPGSAIAFGTALLGANNGFEGTRTVIDVSGDGAQNAGVNTATAASNAHALGFTINGLVILGEANVQAFYQNSIVTPGGGLLYVADGFDDFGRAVQEKIGREVPEPASLLLLGLGAAALGGRRTWRRRRTRS